MIQRGNDRQAIFFHDGDYACYLRLLAEAARHHGFAIHTYDAVRFEPIDALLQ